MSNWAVSHDNETTELYHHGIKGQKWGIRRYQNPDGTLTEEGKLRYRKMTSDVLRLEFSPKKSSRQYIRQKKAADLGIKALRKMDFFRDNSDGIERPITDDMRSWFLFEDQTIGMPMVADWINRGYSAKECKNAISRTYSDFKNGKIKYNSNLPQAQFEIIEGIDYLSDFADACETVKNEEKNHSK